MLCATNYDVNDCWFDTERIELFEFLYGFQYTTINMMGIKNSVYIPSEKLIINEIITMVCVACFYT